MLLDIEHRIQFSYDDYISESWIELIMEPRMTERQTVSSFYLAVGPPSQVFRYRDWLGNVVHHFGIAEYHDKIEVVARSVVETEPAGIALENVRDFIDPNEELGPVRDFLAFGGPIQKSKALLKFAKLLPDLSALPIGRKVQAVGDLLGKELPYHPNVPPSRSTADEAIEKRAGVCQDFAQVCLGILRLLGIPCRYVSGYLHITRDDHEVSESHAWIEIYSPSHGWVGFDPTHNCVPNENYVVVAVGRHYDDVPPNRGIYRGNAGETLVAEVRTRPTPKSIVALREEIGQIGLPVYAEAPTKSPHLAQIQIQDQSDQQQQQQQLL